MEPTTTAAIASEVANLGSSILGGMSSKKSAKKSYKRQIALMQMQRQWELENYQNAHQWEAVDLDKAGMNRALTAYNPTGISSPSISAPTPAMAEGTKFGDIGSKAMGTIATLKQLEVQTEMAKAQAERDKAQALKTTEESNWIEPSAKQQIRESNSRIAENDARREEINSQTQLNQENVIRQRLENSTAELMADMQKEPWYKWKIRLDAFLDTISSAVGIGKDAMIGYSAIKGAKSLEQANKNLQMMGYKNGVREYINQLKDTDPQLFIKNKILY